MKLLQLMEQVVRKWLLIKDVPKFVAEMTPIIVGNFEQPVLHAKGVQIVDS